MFDKVTPVNYIEGRTYVYHRTTHKTASPALCQSGSVIPAFTANKILYSTMITHKVYL